MADTARPTSPAIHGGSVDGDRREASQSRLRLVLEHTADVILQFDTLGTLLWASPSLTRTFGWVVDDVVGTQLDLGIDDERARHEEQYVVAVTSGEEGYDVRAQVRCADGSRRWGDCRTRLIRDEDGRVESLVTSIRDVSAQVLAERALAESEQRYRMLAENASDVVLHTGPDGRIAWASPSITALLGWEPSDVVGGAVTDLLHPDDLPGVRAFVRDTVARGVTTGRAEARFRTAAGGHRWMSVGGRALRDADGTLIGGIDALRDIQAEHDAREELLRQAHLDPLTGLPNRRALLARLAAMLGADGPTDHRVVAMFLDVDHLKRVNDTFGHEGGDDVLVEVGQRLATAVNAADEVARVGGDEFVVLLGGIDGAARADAIASRIARRLRYPIRLGVEEVVVGASIGMTTAVPGDTVASLLRRADSALYAAKLGGRGRIEHA